MLDGSGTTWVTVTPAPGKKLTVPSRVGGKFGLTYPVAPVKAPTESPTSTLDVVPLKTVSTGADLGPGERHEDVEERGDREVLHQLVRRRVLSAVTRRRQVAGGGPGDPHRAQGAVGDRVEDAVPTRRGSARGGQG